MKEENYLVKLKESISNVNVFGTITDSYIKRVTKTSSTTTIDFFKIAGLTTSVVNVSKASDIEALCTTANKYLIPEKDATVYGNAAQNTAVATNYPRFNADVVSLNNTLSKITAAAPTEVPRRNLYGEYSKLFVNAMYDEPGPWNKISTATDVPTKTYFLIDKTKLANALDKKIRDDPESYYRSVC
jgi:hypothetical protein